MRKDKSFPDFLRSWRERNTLTQPQAAAQLGINARTYEGYELGRTTKQERFIRALVAQLDGPPEPELRRPASRGATRKPVSAILDPWKV